MIAECDLRDGDRVLAFRGGALGDFVLALPTLAALRRAVPGLRIVVVARAGYAAVAKACGLADEVIGYDSAAVSVLFAGDSLAASREGERWRGYKAAVLFGGDADGAVSARLKEAGVPCIVAVRGAMALGRHAAEHLGGVLEALGVEGGIWGCRGAYWWRPLVRLPSAGLERGRRLARRYGRRVVVMHAGSGSRSKNWPAENYAAMAGRFRSAGYHPVFTIGEADEQVESELAAAAAWAPRIRGLQVLELAELLAVSAGYVGNDSGVTHLAAAVGAAGVAVYGPTDPGQWGPWGGQVAALRAPGGRLSALRVDAVWEAWRSVATCEAVVKKDSISGSP